MTPPLSRVGESPPYADKDFFDRLHDEAAERYTTVRDLQSQRSMVAASLLADDGRASHHGIYARRFPHAPALTGHSTDAATAAPLAALPAGAPLANAPVPELMTGAGEPSLGAP